jgi:hypothetical protein
MNPLLTINPNLIGATSTLGDNYTPCNKPQPSSALHSVKPRLFSQTKGEFYVHGLNYQKLNLLSSMSEL